MVKKLGYALLGLVVVAFVGGFAALAVMDIHVEQTQVSKTVSNDKFFSAQ